MNQKETLFIIDSHSLIYKAYYAIQKLTDSKGNSTNAVYGFVKMIFKIIESYNPDYLVCVFDIGKKTFRNELFSDYKATRQATPPDLIPQFAAVKQIISKMNIPVVQLENYEADDIIGTIAKRFEKNFQIRIISGDKDLTQLISENVLILNAKKGISEIDVLNAEAAEKKYEIKLEQFKDYLGLIGDASDNIPGVKGVGPKTAVKLLKEFNSIESIYENIDKITPDSVRLKLCENKDSAFLSKKLVTINTDAPVEIDFVKFNKSGFQNLKGIFESLEFYSLIKELNLKSGETNPDDKNEQSLNSDIREFNIIEIENGSSLQKELTGITELFLYSGLIEGARKLYVFAPEKNLYLDYDSKEFWEIIYDTVSKKNIEIAGFGLKSICKKFLEQGKNIFNLNLFDYGSANGILFKDENIYKIFFNCFKTDLMNIDEICFEKTGLFESGFSAGQIFDLNRFAFYYKKLKEELYSKLAGSGQENIFLKIEKPLLPTVILMEYNGIKIDGEYLQKLNSALEIKLSELLKKIFDDAGGQEFNVNSTKQLADILFNKLALPAQRKTKTGFSTDSETLEKIRFLHPVIDKILEYRKYTKIKNTYIEPFIQHTGKDGKIHTSFNQTGTSTGRFSSVNPNLQNLPNTGQDEINIRKSFIVEKPGNIFIGADYSQIELRIVAHLAGDDYMINAFQKGEDIHNSTAVKLFGASDANSVSGDMRRLAKTINFGILYGMSAHSLAEETGLFHNQAKNFIDNYFDKFSKIKKYFDELIENAIKSGFVSTLFGRKRSIPELNSKNKNIVQSGIRMAMNMPVQGTSADILKMSMIKIAPILEEFEAKCLLTIHDELIFELPEKYCERFAEKIKNIMENIVSLKTQLKASIGTGKNLSELKH
ncbi:MAG TPA: DNA polymerase I [bacterium]|nr:DNA polymerase I [bacterium]HPN31024.1 DNA polymerase I [bacterium]